MQISRIVFPINRKQFIYCLCTLKESKIAFTYKKFLTNVLLIYLKTYPVYGFGISGEIIKKFYYIYS